MIPLVKTPDDLPHGIRAVAEHCCFCAAPTPLWHAPSDVAVCASCGDTRDSGEIPTKAQWCASPQARGIASSTNKQKETSMTKLFEGRPNRTVGLVVNAPAVFARADFIAWLNKPDNRVFSWHPKGSMAPDEYADVVVLVAAGYEGDSSDMPEDIWRAICDIAYGEYGGPDEPASLGSHIVVRLTNLAV